MLTEAPSVVKSFRSFVSDINTVDNRKNHWRRPLADFMKEYGFRQLGDGKYGAVFGKDGYPYVIKVFMKDTAFMKWLNFCYANQSNPYIPKLRGKVVKITSHMYAVRMEKLGPVMDPNITRIIDMLETPSAYADMAKSDKNLYQAATFLARNHRLLDLHYGNFLERPNGQIVIVDPLYNFRRGDEFTIDSEDVSKFQNIF